MDIHVGDVLELKKEHPCGSRRWLVLRVGMDFRLRWEQGGKEHPEDSAGGGDGMKEFWSARARSLTPYVPGEQPQGQTFIKLNTNENPYPPSPAALAAIRAAADGALRLYPDPECGVLRQALAETYGLRPENVFVGNGSDEVLALCFQAFFDPGREILFPDVTYSFYPVFAQPCWRGTPSLWCWWTRPMWTSAPPPPWSW